MRVYVSASLLTLLLNLLYFWLRQHTLFSPGARRIDYENTSRPVPAALCSCCFLLRSHSFTSLCPCCNRANAATTRQSKWSSQVKQISSSIIFQCKLAPSFSSSFLFTKIMLSRGTMLPKCLIQTTETESNLTTESTKTPSANWKRTRACRSTSMAFLIWSSSYTISATKNRTSKRTPRR